MTSPGVLANPQVAAEPQRTTAVREVIATSHSARLSSVYDEQIGALVQQLFFPKNPTSVRHVGFSAAERETKIAQLCLDVARMLADAGRFSALDHLV